MHMKGKSHNYVEIRLVRGGGGVAFLLNLPGHMFQWKYPDDNLALCPNCQSVTWEMPVWWHVGSYHTQTYGLAMGSLNFCSGGMLKLM